MDQIQTLIKHLVKLESDTLTIDNLIDIYMNRCRVKTRPATVDFYDYNFQKLQVFFKKKNITMVNQINTFVMNEYVAFNQAKGLKNNTINFAIETVKQALKYAHKNEIILYNPLIHYEKLPKDDHETVIIKKDLLKKIITYLDHTEDNLYNLRERVIFFVFIDTGVRANELLNIKVSNIEFEEQLIRLEYTKTRKQRVVFLSSKTTEVIKHYLNIFKPQEYLIETMQRTQMNRKTLYKIQYKLKGNLKIPSDVSISFHKFRHSYATYCLESGADLEFVRKTLGHCDLTITQKYLHISNERLKEQHKAFTLFNTL